jgi:hypothetical protein
MAPEVDWEGIAPKVSAPEYRTNRSDLRIELIRVLKVQTGPVTLNVIHQAIIAPLGLTFSSAKEEKRHRAVVMEALHDLKNGTPSVVETRSHASLGSISSRNSGGVSALAQRCPSSTPRHKPWRRLTAGLRSVSLTERPNLLPIGCKNGLFPLKCSL